MPKEIGKAIIGNTLYPWELKVNSRRQTCLVFFVFLVSVASLLPIERILKVNNQNYDAK